MTDLQQSAPLVVGNQWERRYHEVNASWPADLPSLTGQEAISAAKRLYRLAMKKAFRGPWALTSGNRYSYPRGGTFYVNADRGWHHLVHDLSHHCHRRLHPNADPHGPGHSFIEREMIQHVVSSGWLAGTLRREERPKADIRDVRYARIVARIEAWERKERRAKSALAKLRRTKAYYDRQKMN